MRIDKITFKDNQAWLVIRSDDDEYLGTWHTQHRGFVEALREQNPETLHFGNQETEDSDTSED